MNTHNKVDVVLMQYAQICNHLSHVYDEFHINSLELTILHVLYPGERITIKELKQFMENRYKEKYLYPAISIALDKLVNLKLVKREISSKDRRVRTLYIRALGRKILWDIADFLKQNESKETT